MGIDQIGRSGSRDEKGNRLQPGRLESGRKTDTVFDHKHRNPFRSVQSQKCNSTKSHIIYNCFLFPLAFTVHLFCLVCAMFCG